MPNYNPLTNAVGGAGATNQSTYYNTPPSNFGEYQYIKLTEIVDNFVAAFVGEGKILATALRGDINFHAHRALQELSYDVLKSCKSQEIEVCPSLKMPLPHDYVNYTKITSVDSNGIEHVIYPTRHTSHPFAVEQNGECGYEFNADGSIKHQETCEEGEEKTCDATAINNFFNWYTTWVSYTNTWPAYPTITGTIFDGSISIADGVEGDNIALVLLNDHCTCLASGGADCPDCGTCGDGPNYMGGETPAGLMSSNYMGGKTPAGPCWDDYSKYKSSRTGEWEFPACGPFIGDPNCTLTSDAWTNYSSSGGNNSVSINASTTSNSSVDVDNYFQNTGQRYGLQPEHAQVNGSFFIDCMRGQIHFSSNLAGKTIILHYISDHHGTEDEEIVHKFAEEAMYKWIAYGCLSARVGIPETIVQRFKKEKSAETRKAKIRLSNIKIEEISQVMRNKSKWIKH